MMNRHKAPKTYSMKTQQEYIIIVAISLFVGIAAFLSLQQYIEHRDTKTIEEPIMTTQPTTPITIPENIAVETHLRENIKSIAPEQPVLGGSWYLVSALVDTASKTATIVYEDGHIQGKARIDYAITNDIVTIKKVEKLD